MPQPSSTRQVSSTGLSRRCCLRASPDRPTRLRLAVPKWTRRQGEETPLGPSSGEETPISQDGMSYRVRSLPSSLFHPSNRALPSDCVARVEKLTQWQQSGVTILTRPPIIALQLGRFVGTAPDFRRVATRVDFQDPCVLEDLDGRVLVYEPRAVIIHLGESPLAGHYRTYLLPSKLLTDDFAGATSAKPADLSLIGSSAYLVLLVLQV